MKLPFDFGVKLIFRLLMPGLIISVGLLPILNTILDIYGWQSKSEFVFVVLIVVMGWLIVTADMHIYMLLEGRRYWPRYLWKLFVRLERKRMKSILRILQISESQEYKKNKEAVLNWIENRVQNQRAFSLKKYQMNRKAKRLKKYIDASDREIEEANFDIRNFPMNSNGDHIIIYPTRLGNLLNAFERHSRRVYGIDSIFYWWRLWLKISKDIRDEIDNSQAFADSTIYNSFALYLTGVLWLFYSIFCLLQLIIINYNIAFLKNLLPTAKITINDHLPNRPMILVISLLFLAAGFVVYRLSIRNYAQFGELYKSVFDDFEYKLKVRKVIEDIANLSANSSVVCLNKNIDRKEQLPIAARYLQYYRYRCVKCDALLKPIEIRDHVCKISSGS